MMSIFKLFSTFLFVVLLLTGCQGSNSSSSSSGTDTSSPSDTDSSGDTNSSDSNSSSQTYTVVLPVSSTVLTTNNQIVNIDVRVFDNNNNPYSDGKIVKVNPDDVLTGRDIGTFDKTESTLTNGVATFVYTAPNNLEDNTSNIVFKFYHDSNSSNKKTYTMSIVPEANQTTLTSYTLNTNTPSDVSMDLESVKTVSYFVKDANDNLVEDSNMTSMTIRTLNPSLITLSDSAGNSGSVLSFTNKNSVVLNLETNTKSGLVPIKVDAEFKDANGHDQNLTKVFNMMVNSGPPTAISLAYVSTEQKANTAKFVEKWVVTVTDRYSNLVNTNPVVSMGVLAGFIDGNATVATNVANYLYFDPGVNGGDINATNDTFTAHNDVFANVDQSNDILVLFGSGYTYAASGKWDIQTNSNRVLDLVDDYNGSFMSDLGFAVGNNHREDRCDPGTEWIANVYPDNNSSTIDDYGNLILDIEYDYYLVGKDVMLWVNLVGSQNGQQVRLGEARKVTLRGQGIESESYDYSNGFSGVVRLNIGISNTVEYYKNSNFRYRVSIGDDANWSVSDNSMRHNITSCDNNGTGIAYVDVNITGTSAAGTVTLVNMLPAGEF